MKNIIYGLRDPRNDVYQYIGKSTVGNKRALQHLTKSHSEIVNDWVKELENNWLYPHVDIIEEVNDLNELPEKEKHWIEHYHNINPNLLNRQGIKTSIENGRTEEDEEKFNFLFRTVSELPNILKKERLFRNLTQEEVAKEMGMNRWSVSMCENGNGVNFSTIIKYLLVLKGYDIKNKTINERVKRV